MMPVHYSAQYDRGGGLEDGGGADPDARYDRTGLPVDAVDTTERDSNRASAQGDRVGDTDHAVVDHNGSYEDSLHHHPVSHCGLFIVTPVRHDSSCGAKC